MRKLIVNLLRKRHLPRRVRELEYRVRSQEIQLQLFYDMLKGIEMACQAESKKSRIIVK